MRVFSGLWTRLLSLKSRTLRDWNVTKRMLRNKICAAFNEYHVFQVKSCKTEHTYVLAARFELDHHHPCLLPVA